jgi:hypothetical protein
MVLVGVGFLLGCNHEPDDKSDKLLFEIPKAGYPVSVEASGDEKVDALVRQLVSKRPAPYPSGYWDAPEAVVFANRYSTPEVEAAIKSLKAMGPAVFPALVKHLGDDRYCYSDVWEAWLNHDVGDAVVEVLDDGHYLHSGYKFRETPSHSGGGYLSFEDYLHDRGAESWAEWAKSKLRLEIQMDFIDWCIAKENQRGYVDEAQKKQVLETYEAARLKVKKEYSKNDAPTNGGQPTRLETNQTSLGAGSRR